MATRFLLTVLLIALSVKFFRRYYLQGIILSAQFHTTLGVFILSMLTLIVRPNFITLMIGWDGLGISSYLLVIFYKRTKSLNAGLLTGISNRVGDGIILIVLSGFYRFPRIVLPIISNTKIRTDAKFGEKLLDIFLGDFISKIGKDVLKLSKHHGSVAIFVIELKELNVVVVGSGGVRGGLCGVNLLDDIIELCEFLAFFISLTKTNAHLLCGVHAKGIHDISEEEKVKLDDIVEKVNAA